MVNSLENIAVFIDAGYLNKLAEATKPKVKIDFAKIGPVLAQLVGGTLFRTYFYDCRPHQSSPPTDEERKRYAANYRFLDALRKIPRFVIREGRLSKASVQCPKCGDIRSAFEQKGVDILLSIDLVKLAASGRIGKAVVITGDSDFVPAVRVAKEEMVLVYLVHGMRESNKGPLPLAHDELYYLCDERIPLTDGLLKKICFS
jgi:uncharacterized LabA/DUF88 family protein